MTNIHIEKKQKETETETGIPNTKLKQTYLIYYSNPLNK